MRKRKRIGLFVSYPEITYVRRVIEGIMKQCARYDYDLCVFSSGVHVSFSNQNYMHGDTNIFNLANPYRLDGVIVDGSTLTGDEDNRTAKKLTERLLTNKDLPKCVLELPADGFKLISNNDEEALRDSVRHIIEVHGKQKICILTGQKDNEVAEERLRIYLDEIRKHGLDVLPEHIIYGDFYYFSGDTLAQRIANREISIPEAVICASDTMAMGLIDRLEKLGIRVPEDIIVTGFDASDEGAINTKTITSYEPSDRQMGANAVDYLRSLMEPGAAIDPYTMEAGSHFHAGASCGCSVDPTYAMKRFRHLLYVSSYNMADEEQKDKVALGTFIETYVLEGFTASKTHEECLQNIYNYVNLLRPYQNFFLCLKEDWLSMENPVFEGYPEKMRLCLSNSMVGEDAFFDEESAVSFPTEIMLPKLDEDRERASVFYFSAVHFNGELLGYAVLQRELKTHPVINLIHRNWLRYINNALEMIRSKERLVDFSVRDMMTGAYNRRGMYEEYREMLSNAEDGDSLLVCVADMDGLKYINDTFGHAEGDYGIKAISNALQSITSGNEICVRSGGDEFFLIGIGQYHKEDERDKAIAFKNALSKLSANAGKPYNISASIGCAVFKDCKAITLDSALSEADERMYRYKIKNRKQRKV
ncbi:MAG: GGDEF domain-containing protein [Lachnospiraceae bacterium]|nr:GGDEF domain-containing protein [Lachnospiraceae bacterium]